MGHERATLIVGYAAQLYSAVVSILFAPYVLGAIGAEAYGLVGFLLIAQAWFQLLDAGLSPALTREAARYRGGEGSARSVRGTIRGLDVVVSAIAVPALVAAWAFSDDIARHWLNPETLPLSVVADTVVMMMGILLLRWISGVRRGALVGFERHASIYAVNIAVSTLRYPAIVALFSWMHPSATLYFQYQLAVGLIEVAALWLLSRSLVPETGTPGIAESLGRLRGLWPFLASHGTLALIWILITQTDKLVLSATLSLSAFGLFSLAAAAAAGVNLIVLPISQMLMPKLSRLHAAGDAEAEIAAYRAATRLATMLLAAVASVFGAFGDTFMFAWTGRPDIASSTGTILALYAVGNALMGVGAFPYYLQFARGRLHLLMVGMVGFVTLVTPILAWAGMHYGAIGAAWVWFAGWAVYLASWVTFSHRRLIGALWWRWLGDDVLRIALPTALAGLAARALLGTPQGRWQAMATIAVAGLLTLFTAAAMAGVVTRALGLLQRWRTAR